MSVTIKNQNGTRTVPEISQFKAGLVSPNSTIQANSYKDVTVTFAEPFAKTPTVTATLFSGSSETNYGKISVVVSEVNATAMKLRIMNASDGTYTPSVTWMAITL